MFESRAPTSPQFPSGDGNWAVLQGKHNGEAAIVRIDTSFAIDVAARGGRTERIGFAIPFNDGIDPRNQDLFSSIEDEIERLAKDKAALVAVVTTPRMKEFVLHSTDASWAPAAHELLRLTFERLEVQMLVESDPQWSAYTWLLDSATSRFAKLRRRLFRR